MLSLMSLVLMPFRYVTVSSQAMQVTDVGADADNIGWWLKEVSTQHMHIFTIYPTQHSTGKHGAINVTTFIVTTFSPMIKS